MASRGAQARKTSSRAGSQQQASYGFPETFGKGQPKAYRSWGIRQACQDKDSINGTGIKGGEGKWLHCRNRTEAQLLKLGYLSRKV